MKIAVLEKSQIFVYANKVWIPLCQTVVKHVFVKLQAKSLDKELNFFYPCHKKNNNKKNNKKNPHQNLSEGGVLEG